MQKISDRMEKSKLAKKEIMESYYDNLFSKKKSFREIWEGKVGVNYRVPREVGYLIRFLKNKDPENLSILEIGAGDGLSSEKVTNTLKIKNYVATELSAEGVRKLKKKGINTKQMDATNLKLKDNSFDVVCCFNVMHHVDNPKKMAQEMLRVTKKYFLLCESNGLCVPRKLLELTPRNRRANEKSYFPSTYKSFFKSKYLKWIRIEPFNFVFAFTPNLLYKPAIVLGEFLEKIPGFRWQGSSLLIYGEKKTVDDGEYEKTLQNIKSKIG